MKKFVQITFSSFKIALQELMANKLRTFLSLLGVTIGIFCIVAVFTVLDSLEKNIRNSVAALGDDVLYITKWPWMDEGGTYKWWEYWRRPVMKMADLKAVNQKSQTLRYACLSYSENNVTLQQGKYGLDGITLYAVTEHFEKMQDFDLAYGRYFNPMELSGGNNYIVLGEEVSAELFPGILNPTGRSVTLFGRKFQVIGCLRKAGNNIAGFNFDKSIMLPFPAIAAMKDPAAPGANTQLMVKARYGIHPDDFALEIEGILRAERKLAPGDKNNFSVNKLSQITERLNEMFAMIDLTGMVIAFFSLLVGGFGVANIMFVSVKERTKIIGLKKALGARKSVILTEFLTEAITLCLIGGLLGILTVFLLSWIISATTDFSIFLSAKNFVIGTGISAIVGILAGYIPARAASKLDPVVAIRSN